MAEGRILGFDPGTRRIGVALSDDMQWMARPLEVIRKVNKGLDPVIARISALIAEHEVVELVVGVPYRLDGSSSSSTEMALRFVAALQEAWPDMPITTRDEALTSWEAEQILRDRGITGRDQKALVDAYAAAVILQELLDVRRPPDRVDGPDGPDRVDGPDGPDRVDGPDGPDRVDGPDGPDRVDGPDGPDRVDGPDGPDRVDGPDGPDRVDGPDGPDGPDREARKPPRK